MAVPKKRKYLRFALPKLNTIRAVYRRRTSGFTKGQLPRTSGNFFLKLEQAITTHLFYYAIPMLELLYVHSVSFIIFNKFSILSSFHFRSDLFAPFKHRLFVFGEYGVHTVLSLYSLRCEVYPQILRGGYAGFNFFISGTSGFLRFTLGDTCLVHPGCAAAQSQNQPSLGDGLLASGFFFKKTDSLRDESFQQRLTVLKQIGYVQTQAQPQKLVSQSQTRLGSVITYVKQKVSSALKVNYGATSWVVWFLDLFEGMSSASNIRADLGKSADLINDFFVNTKFYKKVQWKTNFKYYYWTNDPIWMRYRYRIYWYKKALYKKLDRLIFMYFFSRLRSLQKRTKEVRSTWHSARSKHYQKIHQSLAVNSEAYANKFANNLVFSKILRTMLTKATDLLLYVYDTPAEVYKRTFISVKLSLSLIKVIFFGIDMHIYTKKVYSKFLHKVDPGIRVLSQAHTSKVKSIKKGGFFSNFTFNWSKQKKQTSVYKSLTERWKQQLSLKPRINRIFLRRKK